MRLDKSNATIGCNIAHMPNSLKNTSSVMHYIRYRQKYFSFMYKVSTHYKDHYKFVFSKMCETPRKKTFVTTAFSVVGTMPTLSAT